MKLINSLKATLLGAVCLSSSLFSMDWCCENAPDWASRIDFKFVMEDQEKPLYTLETIQPLFWGDDSVVFTQGAANYHDDAGIFTLGAGYRYYCNNLDALIGFNGFYDIETDKGHQRMGVGFDILTDLFDLRGNYYWGISNEKRVRRIPLIHDQALNGGDIELGVPVPYFPSMTLFGKIFQWNGDQEKDIHGTAISLRARVTPCFTLEGGYKDTNKQYAYFLSASLRYGQPDRIEYTFLRKCPGQCEMFSPYNICNRMLEKVRRHPTIFVERHNSYRPD